VRDGEVFTPKHNGTFLNGLNRQRVIKLLAGAGVKVHEVAMTLDDFDAADEIFTTGNASKIMPVARYQDRDMGDAPMAMKVRQMYWDWALST